MLEGDGVEQAYQVAHFTATVHVAQQDRGELGFSLSYLEPPSPRPLSSPFRPPPLVSLSSPPSPNLVVRQVGRPVSASEVAEAGCPDCPICYDKMTCPVQLGCTHMFW